MTDRYTQTYEAARRHYLGGETMEAIAHSMGISRSTVSRMLAAARELGIVRISLVEPEASASHDATEIAEEFGLRVHLVPVPPDASAAVRFAEVSRRAALLLSTVMTDGARLGIAWGVTVGIVARHLVPRPLSGVTVVQLNGSVNAQDTAMPFVGGIMQAFADAYDGKALHFPVPAFFDFADTRQALWRERSVRAVLDEISHLDVALFGVGSFHGRVPSHVYSAGYLEPVDRLRLEEAGVVGDICTVMLREDGSWADIELNQRASGPNPAQLAKVPRRLCVVADPQRVRAVLGALRAGVATDLICDDATLRVVRRRLDSPAR